MDSLLADYDGSARMAILGIYRRALASDFVQKVLETFATRILLIGMGVVTGVHIARILGPVDVLAKIRTQRNRIDVEDYGFAAEARSKSLDDALRRVRVVLAAIADEYLWHSLASGASRPEGSPLPS